MKWDWCLMDAVKAVGKSGLLTQVDVVMVDRGEDGRPLAWLGA